MGPSKRIIIIGAGPGGYVAAIRAAQLGAEVTVIENQALGGVCLNSGCIPSKALLSVIELREKIKKASDMGLRVEGEVRYDLTQMVARKNRVVSGLVGGIATLFKTRKIIHIEGTGALENEQTVRVQKPDGSESVIQGDAIIVATGSSWPNLPQFPIDGQAILTSKEALDLITIPASIVIIGGGVEGCEFATYFSGLGAKVSVVEMMSRILPQEDEEIANVMLRELKKRKVDVHSNTTVKDVGRIEALISLTLSSGVSIETETV
jgi:dihydrolipoamide dehydrogenase